MNATDTAVQPGPGAPVNARQQARQWSLGARILGIAGRIIAALVSLAMALFCGFGFLASFEPGPDAWFWKITYGTLAGGLLAGAAVLVRGCRGKADGAACAKGQVGS
jgi:hypothetical protein